MPEVPKKQMAAVIEKTGGPIEYKEIDVAKPGPDEILINIKWDCSISPKTFAAGADHFFAQL